MSFVGGLRDGAERLPLDAVNSQLGANRGAVVTAECGQGHLHQALKLWNGRGHGVLLMCDGNWLVADVPGDYVAHPGSAPLTLMRLAPANTDPKSVAGLLALGGSPPPPQRPQIQKVRKRGPRPVIITCYIFALLAFIFAMLAIVAPATNTNPAIFGLIAFICGLASVCFAVAYGSLRKPVPSSD
jgi:hypothetical protein